MKKIMWIVSVIPFVVTAVVLQFMPESVPMHYDLAGNIDRWGSKNENLIVPVIILMNALLMHVLIGYFEKKAGKTADEKEQKSALSNAKTLGIVGTAMSVMFGLLQYFLLYNAYEGADTNASVVAVDMNKVGCILMGILFIVLGNFLTKTRVNGWLGVRTSWSMYNDNTWRKSNHFGAYVIILAGFATILTALLLTNSFMTMMVAVCYLLLAVVVVVIYSYKVYADEKAMEKTNPGSK